MNDVVIYEPGKYGLRAVVCAPWSHRMRKEMQVRNVKEVELNAGKGWTGSDISFLSELPGLKSLIILDLGLHDVEPIHGLRELEALHISAYYRTKIDLTKFPALRDCALEWGAGADSLFECTTLERLFVNRYPGKLIRPFLRLVNLQNLAIYSAPIPSLSGIGMLASLETLKLALFRTLASLEGIQELKDMKALEISTCRKIIDIRPVNPLRNLEVLHIDNCGSIESLHPIAGLERLRSLSFVATTNIRDGDLSPIRKLLALESLRFQDRTHYTHRLEDFIDTYSGRMRGPVGQG